MNVVQRSAIRRQTFVPRNAGPHNTDVVSSMGIASPESTVFRQGRDWTSHQVCRQSTFSLVVFENYLSNADFIGYTRQEEYIKVNFWLGGKHTTVLDGFGQCDHDSPEIFVTSSPRDTLKVDLMSRATHISCVALCVLPEFFPLHMGMEVDELPTPLKDIAYPKERPFSFLRFALTSDITAATQAILAAPLEARRHPLYAQAKAVELMCLLLVRMRSQIEKSDPYKRFTHRHEARLHDVRDLLTQRYAEHLTMVKICRETGLNRALLTEGFRKLFNMSVSEYLRKVRMEQAYALLLEDATSIKRIAEAVGYSHSCNFSTAFHDYFGFSPTSVGPGTHRRSPR